MRHVLAWLCLMNDKRFLMTTTYTGKPVGSQFKRQTKKGQFWVIKIIQTDDDDKLYLYTKLKIENKLNSLQLAVGAPGR